MSIARMIVKSTMLEKKERFENELKNQPDLERENFLKNELVKLEIMLKDFKINKNGGE